MTAKPRTTADWLIDTSNLDEFIRALQDTPDDT